VKTASSQSELKSKFKTHIDFFDNSTFYYFAIALALKNTFILGLSFSFKNREERRERVIFGLKSAFADLTKKNKKKLLPKIDILF
jgi:hypothetical protein